MCCSSTAEHNTSSRCIRVRRDCSAHSARRRLSASTECNRRARVHSPRQRHARRIRTLQPGVYAAARVTPTAPRAYRDQRRFHLLLLNLICLKNAQNRQKLTKDSKLFVEKLLF